MNFPEAFIHRMQNQLGHEADEFFASLTTPSPTSIRLHHLKGTAPFELNDRVLWCDDGYYLAQRPSFHLDPHWHGGAYYVQEASSMILDAVIKQLPLHDEPKTWLDLCAAPGGKTGILARHMDPHDVLIANELISQRRSVLFENLIKGGFPNTFISGERSENIPANLADIILLDAPCSGEGMMRKEPEAIRQWNEGLVSSCSVLQKQIIQDAIRILKPGGWLIYSTCSYSPDENIENAIQISSLNSMENQPLQFPDTWNIVTIEQEGVLGYQLYPHRVRGEGLFIAAFKKDDEGSAGFTREKKSKNYFQALPASLEDTIDEPALWVHELIDNALYMITRDAEEKATEIRTRFPKAGLITQAGEFKGKDFVPHHFLAMSGLARHSSEKIEIDKEQALDFLERKSLQLHDALHGWNLLVYAGTILGWAKQTSQGFKNHYPMNWRLRQRNSSNS